MSGNMNRPEPPPTPNARPAVWDLVIADMRERDAEGLRKYGTRLQPGNGRDPLVDAYQEALDLVVYIRQAIAERDDADAPPAPDPLSVEGVRKWLQAKYGTDAEWKGDDLLAYARHAAEALQAEVEALALARNRLQVEVGEWITEATKQRAEVARLKAALDEAP